MMLKKTKGVRRVVLIDTHAVLHRGYHALRDLETSTGLHTGAIYGLALFLFSIVKELDPEYIIAAYDLPGGTFRHEQYAEYKGTRGETDDALIEQFDRSRQLYEAMGIPIYDAPGFEADDILGTAARQLSEHDDVEVIIASGDMDTLQLVKGKKVRVYTLRRSMSDTVVYDEAAVKERFGFKPALLIDYKGLRGDPSDNIPGVPGIGEKTATTLISTFGSLDGVYKALEKDKEKFIAHEGVKARTAMLLEEHKDAAYFSRDLATIRTDAPVTVTLDGDHWIDGAESSEIERLCGELEFKTLRARFKQLLAEKKGATASEEELALLMHTDEVDVSEAEFEPLRIMFWLLHSERSHVTPSELFEILKVDSLVEAKEKLEAQLKEYDLWRVWSEIEEPLIPVVAAMHARGVLLDVAHLETLNKEYSRTLKKHEKKIWELAGEEFNVNSPKQLGEILFEKLEVKGVRPKRTATGAYSTNAAQLEKLKDAYPIAREVLEYRELKKLLSTYIETLPGMVADDGRIHARFDQAGTLTGRFSSNDPNLQNIPTRSELGRAIRGAFVAPRGRQLVAFDYSQIELRVAAWLSEDEGMIAAFKNGKDFHAAVAAQVFEKTEDEVSKGERRDAKVINFGIVYGMGVNALKQNLGVSLSEARAFYDRYKERFGRLFEYFDEVKEYAREHGYTTTYFGRRRSAPDIQSSAPFLRAQAERFAMNAPLQGTGADIVKKGMVAAFNALKEAGIDAPMVLQVHDEIILEVDTADVDRVAVLVRTALEGAVTEAPITFKVGVSVGKNWGALKEWQG